MDANVIASAAHTQGHPPLHTPASSTLLSSQHYHHAKPRTASTYHANGVQKGEILYEAVSTLFPRRAVGTVVKELVGSDIFPEWSVEESFRLAPTKDNPYVYNSRFNRLMRNAARFTNTVYDFIVGENRSKYEITDKGREHYGNLQLRHSITQEDIEQGYYRLRTYNLMKEDVEILQQLERGERNAEDPEVMRVQRKQRDFGEQYMRVSTDFALMGQSDILVRDFITNPIRGALDVGMKLLDPKAREAGEFDKWKQNFNLAGEISKAAYSSAENAIRGDFIYDYFVGLGYTDFKESYSRKRSTKNHELENSHIFYNVPFIFYNWLGKFVWQDMMIDWWLRPEKSNLLNYMRDHAPEEGMPFYKRGWNALADVIGFSVMRTYQIVSHMYVSVSAFFTPGRYYGWEASLDILDSRISQLLSTVGEFLQQQPNCTLDAETITTAIKEAQQESRKINPQKATFHAVSALLDKAATNMDSTHRAALEHQVEKTVQKFMQDYAHGKIKEIKHEKENNLKLKDGSDVDFGTGPLANVSRQLTQLQDNVGNNLIKPATSIYATGLQKVLVTGVEAVHKLQGKATSADDYDKISHLSRRAAASWVAYGPYFAAKRDGDYWIKNSSIANIPTVAIQKGLNTVKFHDTPSVVDTQSAPLHEGAKKEQTQAIDQALHSVSNPPALTAPSLS